MSYIDTINHSYVGNFAGLPVYHPLENLDEEKQDEFSATPQNLILGGGSGEHPGLVIQDLDFCVWQFLDALVDLQNKDMDKLEFFTKFEKGIPNYTMSEHTIYSNLEYSTWPMQNVARFVEQVNKEFDESIEYYKTKDKFNRSAVELKINIMIGEFVFFAAKKLISEPLLEYIEENKHLLEKDNLNIEAPFHAVKVSPKGYHVSGRSLALDKKGEVQTKWGLRFDEEHLIDPILNDPNRNNVRRKRM